MAKALARKLGYRYIDSGAMYRAVTLFIQQHDISLEELATMTPEQLEKLMDHIHISFHLNPETGLSEVYLNEDNVESKIREFEGVRLGKSGECHPGNKTQDGGSATKLWQDQGNCDGWERYRNRGIQRR